MQDGNNLAQLDGHEGCTATEVNTSHKFPSLFGVRVTVSACIELGNQCTKCWWTANSSAMDRGSLPVQEAVNLQLLLWQR